MRKPFGIACRLVAGAALLVLGACAGDGEDASTGDTTGDGVLGDVTSGQGALSLHLEAADERTTAFTFVVRQGGEVVHESVRPLQEANLPDPANGPHTTPTRFADAFFVLAAGSYDVEVIPMAGDLANLVVDSTCTPGLAEQVMVEAGLTSEILVVAQCDDPRGGLDIVAVINHPPVIVDLEYGTSRLISPCETLTITPFADDADNDPIEYDWQVMAPADVTFEMLTADDQLIFRSETQGTFQVTLTVCDALPEEHKGCTDLVLPIHVVGPAAGSSSCDVSQCMALGDFVAAGCAQVGCQDDPECAANCANVCPCQGSDCPPPPCAPDCTGQECGPDPVCGTSCGDCLAGETCNTQGQCEPDVLPCVPDCSGRECGADPLCGEDCGDCDPGTSCDDWGLCEPDPVCTPDCTDRVCGPDPVCAESCGICSGNSSCTNDGQCVADSGRVVTILLTLSNPRIDKTDPTFADRRRLAKQAVLWAGGDTAHKVVIVRDDNHHGEFASDPDFVANLLLKEGFDVTRIEEPKGGIELADIADADVVWFSNPGYPVDDAQSMATIADFVLLHGGGAVLQGDDMSWHEYNKPLTRLHQVANGTRFCGALTDNNRGDSYRVRIRRLSHPVTDGLERHVYFYGDDIDTSSVLNDPRATVLAWATLARKPICDSPCGYVPVIVAFDPGSP